MIGLLAQSRLFGAFGLAALAALAVGWALIERAGAAALRLTITQQQEQIDQAVDANASLAATLKDLRETHARQLAALAGEAARAAARSTLTKEIRKDLYDAPPADDAPVAPVLSHALDRLRRSAAATDPAGSGGAPDPAARPAGLSGQP